MHCCYQASYKTLRTAHTQFTCDIGTRTIVYRQERLHIVPTTGSIHELTRMVFELELVPSVGSRDRSCCETNGEELLAVRVLQTHVLHDHIHSQMGQSLDGRSQEVCTTVCIAVYSVTIIVTPLLIINTPHSLHSHLSQDSTSSRKTQHSPSHRLQSSIPQPLPIYSRAHTARRPTPPRRTAPCMYNLPSKIARYREDTGPRLVAGRYTPSGFAVDVERGLGMRVNGHDIYRTLATYRTSILEVRPTWAENLRFTNLRLHVRQPSSAQLSPAQAGPE
ncbi:hypothetical protein IAQ61_010642, partial [Plenodomus lingam]|uniref:Predicted protein n=1 Tax=Leptosphaeria maculans (strain JN3 / isolate v23.1.3 / race Av1-4-5-6-7-8) TaxID=985895 RepID=E4ZJJ6_LEPMJ